jgi:hypothetical protein
MKKYTLEEKNQLVKDIDDMISLGGSLRDSCKQYHTDSRTYKNFKRDLNMNTENINNVLPVINQAMITPASDGKKSCRFMLSLTADDMDKLIKAARFRGLKYSTLAGSLLHIAINDIEY